MNRITLYSPKHPIPSAGTYAILLPVVVILEFLAILASTEKFTAKDLLSVLFHPLVFVFAATIAVISYKVIGPFAMWPASRRAACWKCLVGFNLALALIMSIYLSSVTP